jgi:hypothetical protein
MAAAAIIHSGIGWRREPNQTSRVWLASTEPGEEPMWLALAAVTLASALGFCVLALTVQELQY